MLEQKDIYQDIFNKYEYLRFKIQDVPIIGSEIVYLPAWDSMIYALYDNAYEYFKFSPGDFMTVKETKVNESDKRINQVFVLENKCIFSPAELIHSKLIKINDIVSIRKIFDQKLIEKQIQSKYGK